MELLRIYPILSCLSLLVASLPAMSDDLDTIFRQKQSENSELAFVLANQALSRSYVPATEEIIEVVRLHINQHPSTNRPVDRELKLPLKAYPDFKSSNTP